MARARTRGSTSCVHRRDLLKAAAAAGALLVADPRAVMAGALHGPADQAAGRVSALVPDRRLVHADLHNHSLLSDGTGAPELAFQSMRQAGLDVAALTDHASNSIENAECRCVPGIDDDAWRRTQQLADDANVDGQFVALRGFEWTSLSLGHINVWFSEHWIDPLHTTDAATEDDTLKLIRDGSPPNSISPYAATSPDRRAGSAPSRRTMQPFYQWLQSPPSALPFGGGSDGLAGFNHPGAEWGDYHGFEYHEAVHNQVVSIEVFNQGDDYLFERTDGNQPSPINQALNAGWQVGLLGVSDHHGTTWGQDDGHGRAGLWVRSLTRDGVREALASRRFFASRLNGVRFAATANGVPMGGTLVHRRGPVRFEVDIARGREWRGKSLSAQVLAPGSLMPRMLTSQSFTVPNTENRLVALSVDVNVDEANWLLLRISDPALPPDPRATGQYASLGSAVVYASPFWIRPS
jgi:hypothetical protein